METLFDNPWYWVIGGAVLIGLEMLVPGVFLLWMGIAAVFVGMLLAMLPDLSPAWQLLILAGSMVGSIGTGAWVQRRSRGAPVLNHEADDLIGQTYVAATDFAAGRGRIRVGDTTYSAEGPDTIRAGDQVLARGRTGNRIHVTPDNDAAPSGTGDADDGGGD
ncbi:MAG: NfeD family protein [Halothiobacillaceae bacterium]